MRGRRGQGLVELRDLAAGAAGESLVNVDVDRLVDEANTAVTHAEVSPPRVVAAEADVVEVVAAVVAGRVDGVGDVLGGSGPAGLTADPAAVAVGDGRTADGRVLGVRPLGRHEGV